MLNSQSESIWSWRYGVFTKLVSTSTSIPGGNGNFAQFDASPFVQPTVLHNGTVLSRATDSNGNPGFYIVPITGGAVSRVVDTATGIPGTGSSFDTINDNQFGTDGQSVVFSGGNAGDNYGGIFKVAADGSGALTVLASSGDPVNSNACAFPVNDFGFPAIDDDHVVSYAAASIAFRSATPALAADH